MDVLLVFYPYWQGNFTIVPLYMILNKQRLIIMKYRVVESHLNNSTYSLRFLIISVVFFKTKDGRFTFCERRQFTYQQNLIVS